MNNSSVAEEIWLSYADRVLAYARRRVGRAHAEDVVAEVFVIVLRRPSAVPAQPLPWLYATARHVIANLHRSEGRSIEFRQQLPSTSQPDPAAIAGANLAAHVALSSLSPLEREALQLMAWEGLSRHEAARAAGCSRATFAVRLHRARARFRQELLGTTHSVLDREGGSQ